MEVIGRKKHGLTFVYLALLAFLIFSFVFLFLLVTVSNDYSKIIPAVIIFIAIIVALIMFILYLKAPEDPITYNQTDAIYINGEKINLIDIVDVSYKQRKYNIYISFKYGRITVQTKWQTFEAKYVADCENVCKILTKLAYDSQHKEQQ